MREWILLRFLSVFLWFFCNPDTPTYRCTDRVGFTIFPYIVALVQKCLYVHLYEFPPFSYDSFRWRQTGALSSTSFLADSVHHGSRRLWLISWPVALGVIQPSARAPAAHHWQRRIRLVWSNSVGGTSSYYISNHHVNWGIFYAWLSWIRSACGVVMTHLSARATSTYHGQRWICLVWSNSVGGTNSCYYSNQALN